MKDNRVQNNDDVLYRGADTFTSGEVFKQRFFAAVERGRREKRRKRWTIVAAIIPLCAIAAIFCFSSPSSLETSPSQIDPLEEAKRLFGNEVCVALYNGDVIIGDRLLPEREANQRIRLSMKDPVSGQIETLDLSGSMEDTIVFDSAELRGHVIFSRSDATTCVVEVDLENPNQKRVLHKIITISRNPNDKQSNIEVIS